MTVESRVGLREGTLYAGGAFQVLCFPLFVVSCQFRAKRDMPILSLQTVQTVTKPVIATAQTIASFVKRALWRRRVSSHAQELASFSRGALAGSLESTSPSGVSHLVAVSVPSSEMTGSVPDIAPFEDHFEDAFELLPLDEDAVFDFIQNAGLRARILEPESRKLKIGHLITFTFRGWYVSFLFSERRGSFRV